MILTAGYHGRTIDQLIASTDRWTAVIDIRMSPRSVVPGWGGVTLDETLRAAGRAYHHAPGFGNANYRGGPIQIADFEGGLRQVRPLLACSDAVLLCMCPRYEACHRKVVAQMLARCGYETSEMVWAGAMRSLFEEAR